MKYRLLALDLDGTLLNSQKEITPEVRKALAWAKSAVCMSFSRPDALSAKRRSSPVSCPARI